MTIHHTPHTPAPSALSQKLIAPSVGRAPIRLGAIRLSLFSVIRFIQKAALQRRIAPPQPAQVSLPNSLYAALHEFSPPQRPS